jgi:hypothetical protein
LDPWFIATERFDPSHGEAWSKYVSWSGLGQLTEVVSLDSILCPRVLGELKNDYWPHIVNEDFMLDFFVDFEFMMAQLSDATTKNILCVFRNPPAQPVAPAGHADFVFLGYDLVDIQGGISALTNCGGFPDVFDNAELSAHGLIPAHSRATQIQTRLRELHAEEPHVNCHVWAIFRKIRALTTAIG